MLLSCILPDQYEIASSGPKSMAKLGKLDITNKNYQENNYL